MRTTCEIETGLFINVTVQLFLAAKKFALILLAKRQSDFRSSE